MKQGNIVLFRKYKDSFISKAICKITSSSYAHAGVIRKISDKVYCNEALDDGFVQTEYPLKVFKAMVKTGSVLLKESTVELNDIPEVLDKYVGKKYGYFDIVAILIYQITGLKLFKDTSDKLICSEACARFLYDASNKKIDFVKEYNKPYSYITPDDLFMSEQLVNT